MNKVRVPNDNLVGIATYDPKYLPADVMLSANESPTGMPRRIRSAIDEELKDLSFNRYPDPLANNLRHAIGAWYGLDYNNVLVGNGGDELLLDIALVWGGAGRQMLDCPPTFSVYAHNARLLGTNVINVLRRDDDFSVDEEEVLRLVSRGEIDYLHICNPNNPTGNLTDLAFIERLLDASDTLVVLDEAYGDFAEQSALPLLQKHKNLIILHTLSKAYCLAGVRVGYVLAHEDVIAEMMRVRQPYSVDVVSQAIALQVVNGRDMFVLDIAQVALERERMESELSAIDEVKVYPSSANFVLIRLDNAEETWKRLYGKGVLVRDFSKGDYLQNCLRVTVGTPDENDRFIAALKEVLEEEREGLW